MSENSERNGPSDLEDADAGDLADADADGLSDADGGDLADVDADGLSDADKRRLLRVVGDEVRGDSSASRQVAAILYRVSDLYDPDEDTDPDDIYRNVREILRVKERGGKDPGSPDGG